MKKIATLLLGALMVISGFAADVAGRVTLSLYGNDNYQVFIDGRQIYAGSNRILLNDLRPGQHNIQVYEVKRNNRRSNRPVYAGNFTVRPQYDLNILIDRNGRARFDEDRISIERRNGGVWDERRDNRDWNDRDDRNWNDRDRNNSYNRAMADAEFNQLVQRIRGQWFNKLSTARNEVSRNYFTSYQVRRLMQIFSSDGDRLELAKVAYRNTVDPRNFSQVYELLSNNSRYELERYLREGYNR